MILYCFIVCAIYVGSLYLTGLSGARDNPKTIQLRSLGVLLASCLSWIPAALVLSHEHDMTKTNMVHHFRLGGEHVVSHVVLVVVHIGILYVVPCIFPHRDSSPPQEQWICFRNYIIAPVAEEWCFRACMVPLLESAGYTPGVILWLCPLFFGAAHIHHVSNMLNISFLAKGYIYIYIHTHTPSVAWISHFLPPSRCRSWIASTIKARNFSLRCVQYSPNLPTPTYSASTPHLSCYVRTVSFPR